MRKKKTKKKRPKQVRKKGGWNKKTQLINLLQFACLPSGHIHKFKGRLYILGFNAVLRIWMEQALFCYDGKLLHALLEIMMNPCFDIIDKNSSRLSLCLLNLAGIHSQPSMSGKEI